MRNIQLHVGGMGCRRCVREVTARLRDVRGVETVSADAHRSLVRLSGTMTTTDVLAAFTGSTYAPRILDGDPAGPGS
jgi:copper chaperone CopZ